MLLIRAITPAALPITRIRWARSISITSKPTPKPPPLSFSRADIDAVRKELLPPPDEPLSTLPPHTSWPNKGDREPANAAVLIPLCNVGGVATILMTVRAATLRVHAGEASFPGGKAEDGDTSLVQSALRETEEELAIPASHVEVLGSLPPEYSLGNRARVWPIVGFVHPTDAVDAATDSVISSDDSCPAPSISLSTLTPERGEVSALLPVPLTAIADPERQEAHWFRLNGKKPYWKIRVGDLMLPPDEALSEPLEVWGLSGWFLSRLAVRLGWSDTPEESLPPTDD